MGPLFVVGIVCLIIGTPFLIVSIMSLKYREGKPFQAKVLPSGEDTITIKYKIKGNVYIKDLPWNQPHPLAFKPKPGQNVTVKGTPDNPTGIIWSRGGIESSFALKIVGIVIGGFFCLVGAVLLLFSLFVLILSLVNSSRNIPEDFYSSYYGISAMIRFTH